MKTIFFSLIQLCAFSQNLADVFEGIYQHKTWGTNEQGEGHSGVGSKYINCIDFISYLDKFLKTHNISSVVDAGCGDWQYAKNINWDGINYLGIDIAPSVINKNVINYSKENISFLSGNFIDMDLPAADLLLVKDVLMHLSFKNIQKAIRLFPKFKYVICVNDVHKNMKKNHDIDDGGFRHLNLTLAPFSLKSNHIKYYKCQNSTILKQIFFLDNTN